MQESNPILSRRFRGEHLESMHRGAWVLVDGSGRRIDGQGDAEQFVYPRSATKSLQALPLLESGAFERFGLGQRHLALALASHSGEPIHLDVAAEGLERIGLDELALRCGPQRPFGAAEDDIARRLVNNCSGKHIGFLAVSQHLGLDPLAYLDPDGGVQTMVREAVAEMTGVRPDELETAIDGCSAPTFFLPLRALALGLCRVANPTHVSSERNEACRRMTSAARAQPVLIAGSTQRFCTDLIRATDGRIFPKIGAEGVFAFAVVDGDRGFACKIDDGNQRGHHLLVVEVLRRHRLITEAEVATLGSWADPSIRNWDGIEVGHVEVELGD